MNLDNSERKFYQETISNLLQYNGMLITALTVRGQQFPIPPIPSFGISVDMDDMKKLSNSWKDMPTMFPNPDMMGEMLKKFGLGFPSKRDLDDDKAEELK